MHDDRRARRERTACVVSTDRTPHFSDIAGFERACRIARALGFDGKQCIHPSQIATANAVFSPTDAEVAHARRVVEAYDAAAATGRGAVSLDGKMIDEANVRMARVVLDRSQASAEQRT